MNGIVLNIKSILLLKLRPYGLTVTILSKTPVSKLHIRMQQVLFFQDSLKFRGQVVFGIEYG